MADLTFGHSHQLPPPVGVHPTATEENDMRLQRNVTRPKSNQIVKIGGREMYFRADKRYGETAAWDDTGESRYRHYVITVSLDGQEFVSFDFFNSQQAEVEGRPPDARSVFEMLATDATYPTTADEVYAEVGDMKPSQCQAVAQFSQDLRDWLETAGLTVDEFNEATAA